VLLLKDGRIEATGPLADILTSESLSELFGLKLRLRVEDGRYSAIAVQ
jgi:iron complex transport system ATP-binding protein